MSHINSVDEEMDKTIPSITNQQSGDDRRQKSWVGNRRLFLGLAAIGVGALGYTAYSTYNSAKKSSSQLLTSSLTSSSSSSLTSSSLTSTSKELVSLEGELYIGWDGSGIKREEMQPLYNEKMILASGILTKAKIVAETTSDSSGHWEMNDIPTGDYVLYAEADPFSGTGKSELRYMCQSNKDFRPVNGTVIVGGSNNIGSLGSYKLSLNESQKMNFEFSNGFLTLPFPKGTPIKENANVDECVHTENSKWGKNCHCAGYFNQWCGMPGEGGIDFGMPIGTPVVSAAPGKVVSIFDMGPKGIKVIISHEEFTRFEVLHTGYGTMSKVEVPEGQEVYRGQRIGLSGENKTSPGPHLHFELSRPTSNAPEQPIMALDPYASLWNSNYELGYWTKTNDPQFSV